MTLCSRSGADSRPYFKSPIPLGTKDPVNSFSFAKINVFRIKQRRHKVQGALAHQQIGRVDNTIHVR